jgi:hypothetical protein
MRSDFGGRVGIAELTRARLGAQRRRARQVDSSRR